MKLIPTGSTKQLPVRATPASFHRRVAERQRTAEFLETPISSNPPLTLRAKDAARGNTDIEGKCESVKMCKYPVLSIQYQLALPRRIGNAASQHWKAGKVVASR